MIRRSLRPSSAGILLLLLVALVAWRLWEASSVAPLPDVLAPGEYQVARVIDGDTLLLENGARIRIIGADAPETVKPEHPVEPWGTEASAFTHKFCAGGVVRLQMDKERTDKFGRFLAY